MTTIENPHRSAEHDTESQRLLDDLAQCYGIQADYEDVWGKRQAVRADTKRELLQAMGVGCDTADALQQALADFHKQREHRLLAPVQVIAEDKTLLVPLQMDKLSGESFSWQLTEEHGALHEGSGDVSKLICESDQTQPHDTNKPVFALQLDLTVPVGYHILQVFVGQRRASMSLIVTPTQCYLPQALRNGARWWGLATQLYGVRSEDDFGIGDFSALSGLLELCAEKGAALLGLSPLHAMFPQRPEHAGPYSPSSRLFLNTLFIDVRNCPDVRNSESASALLASEASEQQLARLRAADLVDYPQVAAAKSAILEIAFKDFRTSPNNLRYTEFQRFCTAQGDTLFRHAVYDALQEHFNQQQAATQSWQSWPRAFQDPASAAVTQFARTYSGRVDYFRWLQWLADEQLGAAAHQAENLELPIGLYLDIAVSVDAAGAETWANQHLYVLTAAVGAPPDMFNPKGQNWGLPPQNPVQLAESGYALYIDTLRRNMRYPGAIRIDHVMGLMRLYWVPQAAQADQGAYVSYPLHDLLGILALESQRNRCMVIGEDLGTVPPELVSTLQEFQVLSYRLLYFEQNDGEFKPAEDYPAQALVAVSTHDLPTLNGWWQGRDLEWRSQLDLFPAAAVEHDAIELREHDRKELVKVLTHAGLAPETPVDGPGLQQPVHRFLARTPAMLELVQLEDMLGLVEQANMPATVDEHPNWRRRLAVNLQEFNTHPGFNTVAKVVAQERRSHLDISADVSSALCPRATYRLQLHREFTFDDARAIVDYLDTLGISHVYASPYLQSRAGSMHGYDIINHQLIDNEIGLPGAHADWVAALQARGMSHVLDIVPNHMGIMGSDNEWWLDVLEHGQAARHAHYFDIDWNPPERALSGKVLLPVLGEFYGETLAQDNLLLQFDPSDGRFVVRYHEHVFRIDPRQYPFILNFSIASPNAQLEDAGAALLPEALAQELASINAAFAKLPRRTITRPGSVLERYRDSEFLRQRLLTLFQQSPDVAHAIEARVAAINGGQRLHELLERQAWRLAHWRTASDEINYRRFFDINDLAALRTEDVDVFENSHAKVLDLVEKGAVTGLRVDHPDGLYNPARYFQRLAERCAELRPAGSPPIYLVAEKILAVGEALPEDWQVAGTTGYEFASLVNGLFVDPGGEKPLTRVYARFTGADIDFDNLMYQCKRLVMQRSLAAELRVLGNRLHRLAQVDPKTRDYTRGNLLEALREIVACFPVYRTYIRSSEVSDQDRDHVDRAVADAKQHSTAADLSVFDFIRAVVLQQRDGAADYRRAMLTFTMKLQQFTSPVTAKAVEDTAFYRYYRLLSLNDVGDEPQRFGVSTADFHKHNTERLADWPHNMLNASSHDSKRSEDMRARLNILSEIPHEWRERVNGWRRMNRALVQELGNGPTPSRNDEYFIYQSLLGSWPLKQLTAAGLDEYRSRIDAYLQKAVREGKLRSSWVAPDEQYEAGLRNFTAGLFDRQRSAAFLADFLDFKQRIAALGLLNSLSQTVLRLSVPGVPDIYQGTELWNFSLVDPDNRRPVDYKRRVELLAQLGPPGSIVPARRLIDSLPGGAAKLYVIRQLLYLRRRRSALFEQGDYIPLLSRGAFAGNVCGFARVRGKQLIIVVVPRLVTAIVNAADALPMGELWQDTELVLPELLITASRAWHNILTGEALQSANSLQLSAVLAVFPVAVLCDTSIETLQTGTN